MNIFCIKKDEIIKFRKLFWRYFYNLTNKFTFFYKSNLGTSIKVLSIYSFILSTIIYNRNLLTSYFLINENFKSLTTFYITTGAALIGTTVLVFTLVMFAMQVNVEKMPHGLFHKLSNDKKIVLCFFGTFFLAILISGLSLVQLENCNILITSILIYLLSITTIIILFIYTYKRALLLINPLQQLNIILSDVNKEILFWMKIYNRLSKNQKEVLNDLNESLNINKLNFFKSNQNWSLKLKQSIKYAISFVHKYSEQGDYEVSKAALNIIVLINQNYVKVKAKTFFNSNGFLEIIPTTDDFINETLEDLRQAVKVGVSRGDEKFIEQIFYSFLHLIHIYSKIEYSSNNNNKTHAILANGYLENAIKSVLPHDMTDVIMEGCHVLGNSAGIILNLDKADSLKSIIDTFQIIAFLGLLNEKHAPVTLTSMEQLSNISTLLLLSPKTTNSYIMKDLRKVLTSIATMHINLPQTKPFSLQTNIDPYFSHLSLQSFLTSLTEIVNTLLEEKTKNDKSSIIINNIEKWSDQIYIESKELLLLSVEKKSIFISDILNWIKIVSQLLMATSNAISCDEYTKEKLQKNASWLIFTYSWIPKDKKSIQLVENYQLTELIFELILKSYQRDCKEIGDDLIKYLLKWGFEAGQVNNSNSTCENSIYALCSLTFFIDSFDIEDLKNIIKQQLNEINENVKFKIKISEEIRNKSASIHKGMARYSTIENYMLSTNIIEMKKLLNEVSDLFNK